LSTSKLAVGKNAVGSTQGPAVVFCCCELNEWRIALCNPPKLVPCLPFPTRNGSGALFGQSTHRLSEATESVEILCFLRLSYAAAICRLALSSGCPAVIERLAVNWLMQATPEYRKLKYSADDKSLEGGAFGMRVLNWHSGCCG